jgi:hypothetical protein
VELGIGMCVNVRPASATNGGIEYYKSTGCFGSVAASRYLTTWVAGFGQKRTLDIKSQTN